MTAGALDPLPPLPPQPDDVAWPTMDWPTGDVGGAMADPRAAALLAAERSDRRGSTRALLVAHGGRLVLERYAGTLDDGTAVDATTTLPSWSLAKSVLHALVGVLVGDGRLRVDDRVVDVAPGAVPGWLDDPHDPRRAITVDHLLHHRCGLAWAEDYTATGAGGAPRSDVVEMLYGEGRADTAGFAAAKPLAHPPGSDAAFCYSSGTSNLLSAVVRELTGPGDAQLAVLRHRLLGPLGMTSATPKVDAAGTWMASTYCFVTARDLLRFGLLYLRDGVWEGQRLLPEGWVDHGRRAQPRVRDGGWAHGAHWWSLPGRTDWFFGSGYQGQCLVVAPTRDLVVVRLGVSDATQKPAVIAAVDELVTSFDEQPAHG